MRVPFVDLKAQYQSLKPQIDQAIAGVIETTAFIGGPFVRQFEQEFARLVGVKHCVSCANGTDSLFILLKMLGIGRGDEVITVANSWISSSETITLAGASPVFVDVHPDYYSLDENLLEAAITPRTKAIIAVHLQGQMCEMEVLGRLCSKYQLSLIEDCAQSHLSEYRGIRAGLFGVAGSFSFYPGKNLGAYGDAGCIVTNDDELAQKCLMFARHGALIKHQHKIEGMNSRLDGLQAAILLAKLPFLEQWTKARAERANWYEEALAEIPEIVPPVCRPDTYHSYHLYVIRCQRRQELMNFLSERTIETVVHYPTPLPLLEAYRYLGKTPEDFPVSSRLSLEILSLPMFPELTREQVAHVAQSIKAFYQ
ncbi:DegT/DnrJ/EryC1/StrS family aminotransferase [bacterium]|nr:DegT/DnrJ/EryC1/StrS family aminotransferase [bacterium]